MKWLLQLFTWWNEQTLSTRLHTWRYGERVGEDQFGNVYYRWRDGKIDPALGFNRRWVIFNGVSEGSKVPPGWYGWLHHMTERCPPTRITSRASGKSPTFRTRRERRTPGVRQGSTLAAGTRPKATGDYQAWSPEA